MSDIDPKLATSIKRTQELLGKHVKRPPLSEKNLARPPFRYLHDIVTHVINSSGFMKGVFTTEELDHGNISTREAKCEFMQKFIKAIKDATGEEIPAKVSKILTGQEADKTNELLQALARAIEKSGARISTPVLTAKEIIKATEAKQKGKEQKAIPGTNTNTKDKKPVGKAAVPLKTETAKTKVKPSNAASVTKVKLDEKPNKVIRGVSPANKAASGDAKGSNARTRVGKTTASKPSTVQEAKPKVQTVEPIPCEITTETEKVVEKSIIEATKIPSLGEPTDESSGSRNITTSSSGSRNITPSTSGESVVISLKTLETDTNSVETLEEKIVAESVQASESESSLPIIAEDLVDNYELKMKLYEAPKASTSRPTTARRPPPSRNGFQPMVFNRVDDTYRPPEGRVMSVILDSIEDEQEDEAFVAIEVSDTTKNDLDNSVLTDVMPGEKQQEFLPPPEHRGYLVNQIINTQQELEAHKPDLVKTNLPLSYLVEQERQRAREIYSSEIDKLLNLIQLSAKNANPVAKLLDYVAENVHLIETDIRNCREENSRLFLEIEKAQMETEKSLEPLQKKLKETESKITEKEEDITVTNMNIFKMQRRIEKVLAGVNSAIPENPRSIREMFPSTEEIMSIVNKSYVEEKSLERPPEIGNSTVKSNPSSEIDEGNDVELFMQSLKQSKNLDYCGKEEKVHRYGYEDFSARFDDLSDRDSRIGAGHGLLSNRWP